MKTYTDEQIIRDLPIDDDREWVPAEVAKGLYDALELFSAMSCGEYVTAGEIKEARAALAAADGEEV